ncbi:MAG: hypothetical protein C5B59_01150 [Bacteroidetes bacterium]|nr:MAG: hypothetical protein C5B59_01150 [Bacteroidota bacterium]
MNFRKKLFLLILFSTLLRMIIAAFLEFGNDEVYYWTYAQHLAWNYFDHPPMVALLIRLSTINLLFQSEFSVRLGSILCAALNTWIIYLIGTKIKDERTGWYAALLYTSSFYCSIIAGTFILPDSPQLLFWVLSVYTMTKIVESDKNIVSGRDLLLLGIFIGLCIMSKVHGVFLWFGFGLYILLYRRNLLGSPYLYISVLLTLIIISPILWWNIQNHFITYSYHGSRVGFFGKKLDTDSLLQQIFGSLFYNNPINMVMYVVALVSIARKGLSLRGDFTRLYLLLAFPLILVLLGMSLFNETLPHWSGPAYITIMLLAAAWLSAKNSFAEKTPKSIIAALGLFVFVVVVALPGIKWLPVPLGSKEERVLGKNDITLDMSGWDKFAIQFDSLYRDDVAKGKMKEGAFILSDYWFPAAHLDYYLATPLHMRLFAAGKLVDIHNYAWLNKERPLIATGSDAYFIYPSNYYGPPREELRNLFRQVEDSVIIVQHRSGVPVRNFVIYRMRDYLGGLPADGVLDAVPGNEHR